MKSIKLDKNDIQRHTFFWSILILSFWLFDPFTGKFWAAFISGTSVDIEYMMTYYLLSLFVFPKFWHNKYQLIGSLIVSLLLYSCIDYVINYYLIPAVKESNDFSSDPLYLSFSYSVMIFSIIAFCASSFYINKLSIQELNLQNAKEKALLVKEINFFKNQFNAHITFNFLNYCYSRIHKHSERAANAIDLYSDTLRYVMKNKPNEKVLLAEDIKNIKNYIGLQKLLNDKVCVDFNCEGEASGRHILPGIFITFIENAFKHGIYTNAKQPVKIDIKIETNEITFQISNLINKNKMVTSTGIGHTNVKQLLDLFYPDKHRLQVYEKGDTYISLLELAV